MASFAYLFSPTQRGDLGLTDRVVRVPSDNRSSHADGKADRRESAHPTHIDPSHTTLHDRSACSASSRVPPAQPLRTGGCSCLPEGVIAERGRHESQPSF